jgi:hypothetical protein
MKDDTEIVSRLYFRISSITILKKEENNLKMH